ncbi:MAG: AarF/UbiB family protein, partial [Paracoccaceae bacterium]
PKDLQNIAFLLVEWTLREIFDFQLLQSDPNFANYRYDDANERLILLDFGASVEISSEVVSMYRDLIGSVLCNDKDKLLEQMATHNLLPKEVPDALKELLDRILDTALEEFHRADLFSFAESKVFDFLTPENMSKLSNLTPTQVIPTDVLLIQRKLIGMVFLLRRLGAALPLKDLIRKQSCQSV